MILTNLFLTLCSLSLPQDLLFLKEGDHEFGRYGAAMTAAGDLNGDFFDDFVITGSGTGGGHGGSGGSGHGYVQAWSGVNGQLLWQVNEEGGPGKGFGSSIARIDDLNGDQIPEFLVGSPRADTQIRDTGRVHIFSGSDGVELATLDGMTQSFQYFGAAVAALGDINFDLISDFAIGSYAEPSATGSFGRIHVYSGANLNLLYTIEADPNYPYLGYSLVRLEDINGDGISELAAGAYGNWYPANEPGAAYVFSGADGTVLNNWIGPNGGDLFGSAVGNAGDVDGGGRSDILVGAPGTLTGAAYLYSTETGNLLWSQQGNHPSGRYGASVSGVGDTSGDSFPDWAVGAPEHSPGGKAFVYSGAILDVLWSHTGSVSDTAGDSVACLGDLNQDSWPEVGVGSTSWDLSPSNEHFGRVHIYAGELVFLLEVSPLIWGVPATITASHGPLNGEQVYFLASRTGSGPSDLPPIGTVELSDPILLLGSAITSSGTAFLTGIFPNTIPSGTTLYAQAALRRNGEWLLSEGIETTVQ